MSTRIVLDNCSIADPTYPQPVDGSAILIVDDRISWVGPAADLPRVDDAVRLDLGGAYVVPGLNDSHVHLFGFLHELVAIPENVARHALHCARQASEGLKGGFTGLRCLGDVYSADIGLRDSIEQGVLLGPRLRVAGAALTPSGGHAATGLGGGDPWVVRVCDGVEGWQKAARDQLQAGADHLKVIITGGAIGDRRDVTGAVTVTEAELRAAADVFHSRGLPVVAHAASSEGVLMAIRCGVRSVEHGYVLNDQAVEALASSGTYLTPTLSVTHQVPSQLVDEYDRAAFAAARRADWHVERAEARREEHLASFRRALSAGVGVLAGSDAGPLPLSSHAELNFLRRAGMSDREVLAAATRNAADANGQLDDLGTIAPGKYADLVATRDNPFNDIRVLRRPSMVLIGGQVALDHRERSEADAIGASLGEHDAGNMALPT